jgi:hypothetical protein
MSNIFHKEKPSISKDTVEKPKGSKPKNMSKYNGWNVVSYITNGTIVMRNGFGKVVDKNKCEYNEEILKEDNRYYEVYRHRDSQYFKIGDKVRAACAEFIITGFILGENGLILMGDNASYTYLHTIEKVTEVKKDWTILSFRWKFGDRRIYNHLEDGTYSKEPAHASNHYSLETLLHDDKYDIYSVRHEQDGEIFTIGDKYYHYLSPESIDTIHHFHTNGKSMWLNSDKDFNMESNLDNVHKVKNKLINLDSYLMVGKHIPTAFYDIEAEWWWYFDGKRQVYILDQPDSTLEVREFMLNRFEYSRYIPFYNDSAVNKFKEFLE